MKIMQDEKEYHEWKKANNKHSYECANNNEGANGTENPEQALDKRR